MPRDKVEAALAAALEPYDENKDVEQVTEPDGETYWRNPQAKWDWWAIGGRWPGYFIPRDEAPTTELIYAEYGGVFGHEAELTAVGTRQVPKVDGGRRRALDFEAMRNEAAARAAKDWDAYATAIAGTPDHKPWADYVARVELAEAAAPVSWDEYEELAEKNTLAELGLSGRAQIKDLPEDMQQQWRKAHDAALATCRQRWSDSLSYTINQARADYHAQPRIAMLRRHPTYRTWWNSPEEVFAVNRDAYVLRQVRRAVPGYATVRLDGAWLAPGTMGWFGMSDDNDDSYEYYTRKANEHLDSLTPEAWVVVVDAHI